MIVHVTFAFLKGMTLLNVKLSRLLEHWRGMHLWQISMMVSPLVTAQSMVALIMILASITKTWRSSERCWIAEIIPLVSTVLRPANTVRILQSPAVKASKHRRWIWTSLRKIAEVSTVVYDFSCDQLWNVPFNADILSIICNKSKHLSVWKALDDNNRRLTIHLYTCIIIVIDSSLLLLLVFFIFLGLGKLSWLTILFKNYSSEFWL